MNTITARLAAAAGALVVVSTLSAAPAFAADATFPPTANTDGYSTAMDVPLTVDAANGILINDLDGGNNDLAVNGVTLSSGGTIAMNPDGSFVFTPDAGFVGAAHFVYHDIAGGMLSNNADIWIDVTAPAPVPCVAAPDFYSTPQDTVLATTPAIDDLISNDPIACYVKGIDDVTGEVTVNTYGTMVYTPAAGFVGTKTFSYYTGNLVDTTEDSAWVLVTIDVTATKITIIPSNPLIPGTPAGSTVPTDLPTLAYTGTDDVTTWLIAPGIALVAAGAFAVWFTRRRAA